MMDSTPGLRAALDALFRAAELVRLELAAASDLPGSYWGDTEAGIIGRGVYVRTDTPLHSLLHELGHVVCADPVRGRALVRDAGGDDDEEAAVCLLQVCLAEALPGVGARSLAADMDAWGYSFRQGSTGAFLGGDARDAADWLDARRPAAVALLAQFGLDMRSVCEDFRT